MSLRPGFPAVSEAATFLDIRRAVESEIAHDATGAIRAGVYPIFGTGPILSGTSDSGPMTVDVAPFLAGLDRNGLVRVYHEGTDQVEISAAPGSGSRWSVVYVKQRESGAPMSDGADGPVLDKVESTVSLSAAEALVPAGAEKVGYLEVPAGVTTTDAGGVVIATTIPFTAPEGATVFVRNSVELEAWEPADGARAYQLDAGIPFTREGGEWVADQPTLKLARSTDLSSGVTSSYGAAVFQSAPSEWSIGWDLGTAGRITILRDGLYLFEGVAVLGSTASGYARLRVNGSTYSPREFSAPNSSGAATVPFLDVVPLTAGDYVELMVKSDGTYTLFASTRLEVAMLARR